MQTQKELVLRLLHSEPSSPLLIEGYDFAMLGNFLRTEIPADPSEPLHVLRSEDCSMDEVRGLISKLSRKSHARRFVVLEKVHRFRKDASNALLKLLEEPPLDTHLILTSLPYATLGTIRSRCSVVKFLSAAEKNSEKEAMLTAPLAHKFLEMNERTFEEHSLLLESFIYQAREDCLKETSSERAVKKSAVIQTALAMLQKGVYSKISLQNIFIMWKYA